MIFSPTNPSVLSKDLIFKQTHVVLKAWYQDAKLNLDVRKHLCFIGREPPPDGCVVYNTDDGARGSSSTATCVGIFRDKESK